MFITIGILAHNEESDIGNLIADLGTQTLLSREGLEIEIRVVANGCRDATVQVSQAALAALPFRQPHIRTFVHDLAKAGKSNAWNELIHTLASPQTQYIFLLDADIRIPESTTMALVLDGLLKADALVAVDESVKDLSLQGPRTFSERLILAATGTSHDTRTAIAGALYCARMDVLKTIWMPIGLPGEDGFLRAMILTSNFKEPENPSRHVFVPGARHIFESERSLVAVFRHNVRLAIGSGINFMLFEHFRELLARPESLKPYGDDVAEYVRQRNIADPNWINALISEEFGRGRRYLLNKNFLFKRLKHLASRPRSEWLPRLPVAIMGFFFDVLLFLRANYLIRRGAGAGFW